MAVSTPKIALYQEVFEKLARAIDRGEYMVGSRFWSISELCIHYHISEITARRVLRELTDAGYIRCEKRHRAIVTERPKPVRKDFRIAMLGSLTHSGDATELGPWTFYFQQAIILEMLAQKLIPQICEMRDYRDAELNLPDCDAILAMNVTPDCYDKLVKTGKPFVLLGKNPALFTMPNTMSLDFAPACRKIAEYFLTHGVHSLLATHFPMEPSGSRYAGGDVRFEVLYDTLAASGQIRPTDMVLETCPWPNQDEALQKLMKPFLEGKHPRPYGFAVSDVQAREICALCRIAGLQPGTDFRIVALSGLPGLNMVGPQISSLVFPFTGIARRCCEYFRNVLEGGAERKFAALKIAVDFEPREV